MQNRKHVPQKRILVTGGSGFVAANLIRKLVEEHEVHVIVRPDSDLWRLNAILSRLYLHQVDLEHFDQLASIIHCISPSVIFHLAAHGASSLHRDPFKILNSNIIGTFNLLQATKEINYEFFLHMGGSSEYGNKTAPMNERDVLEPNTFYGLTKACSTLFSQQFALEYQKPIAILRAFSVYGYFESALRLIPTAIQAAFQKKPLRLTAPGFSRDFIFVEDVVEACLTCWKKKITKEIINIGTGKQTTNEEVIAAVERLTCTKIDILPEVYPHRPSDKSFWVADIEKSKSLLGLTPYHTLEEGLKKTIDWFAHA
jgi:nucleoside-diphosphate-sugar epimerase